jgi:hypothetical protein
MIIPLIIFAIILLMHLSDIKEFFSIKIDLFFNEKKIFVLHNKLLNETKAIENYNIELNKKLNRLNEILEQKI